ncbi:uncharacterized protein LOC107486355 [Arachis duranensis]|uniref:Uncharacterized protein LOC107486355 n=1 Tax=Arachis duranensis TaxID=130453 RepID=A0A6P5NJR9_ARADU|nr:uncharacterized protein LOC107486355 [Arachis duranensis]XP_052115882.1 uncharacterized protein LOC107486355 [Arachis duranensis]
MAFRAVTVAIALDTVCSCHHPPRSFHSLMAVFFNVVGGWTLAKTARNLAITTAIYSSFMEFPIPKGVAFIGEVGLGGELHMVPKIEKKVNTVVKLGYRTYVVPN